MKASTRRWVFMSALGLLALDLGAFGVAGPQARGWLERAGTPGVLRAGAIVARDLGAVGRRNLEQASIAVLTRFTQHSDNFYAFFARTTPSMATCGRCARGTRHAHRMMVVEMRSSDCGAATDCPLNGPRLSCPDSGCPKGSTGPGASQGSSSIGLPISGLGMTLE